MKLREFEVQRRRAEPSYGGRGGEDYQQQIQGARGRTNDPELWCGDLDWLINESASELGETGTFGGFVSTMEHGGPGASTGWNTEPPSDHVLGTSARYLAGVNESSVTRHRRLMAPWILLPSFTSSVITARYSTFNTPQWPGADGELGYLKGVIAYALPERLEVVLRACQRRDSRTHRAIVKSALKDGETFVRESHRDWYQLARAA